MEVKISNALGGLVIEDIVLDQLEAIMIPLYAIWHAAVDCKTVDCSR
jgi:hypothetical protein